MSYILTPESLQGIAVKVVCKYMTKQASLSDAVAAEAKDLELNPEQIKRVIESSNTIAYLRQLEDANDRSFEFPLADYTQVMAKMVLPEATTVKVANNVGTASGLVTEPITSTYSAMDSFTPNEKMAMIRQEAFRVQCTLTKMSEDCVYLTEMLTKKAAVISQDPLALEKLAHVTPSEDLLQLKALCGLEKSAGSANSASSAFSGIFTENDLKEVMSLNSLYKEAKDLVRLRADSEDLVKRASSVAGPTPIRNVANAVAGATLGAPIEHTFKGLGYAGRKILQGGIGLGKGAIAAGAALSGGKTLGQSLEGKLNLGFAAMAGADTTHANPVWESIHG